jgi:hypothetical protein
MMSDGSILAASSFTTDGKQATIRLPGDTSMTPPIGAVASVLLASTDPELVRQWSMRAKAAREKDVLELYKEGKRHELEGIIATVNTEGLTFRIDGQDVPVKLDRASAFFFAHPAIDAEALADVNVRSGSVWAVAKLALTPAGVEVETPSGLKQTLPLESIAKISFARGRIVHLSDLEPTLVEHTPFFDTNWDYKRDTNFSGQTPSVAGQSFSKALALHSRTKIEYDLDRHYRRFETSLGIDDEAGTLGDAMVRISGDGKLLWEGEVAAGQSAKPVVLPVTGVDLLTLEVDFGRGLDLGDHVIFGDVKVIK